MNLFRASAISTAVLTGASFLRRIDVAQSGGHFTAVGDTPIKSSGQINRRGIVNLTFQGMDKVAHATGSLAAGSGSGTWSFPSLHCAGPWHAVRHN